MISPKEVIDIPNPREVIEIAGSETSQATPECCLVVDGPDS